MHQNDRRRRPLENQHLLLALLFLPSGAQVDDIGPEAVGQDLKEIRRHGGAQDVEGEEQVRRRTDEELDQVEDSDRQPRHFSSENSTEQQLEPRIPPPLPPVLLFQQG